jgi:glycosyltransferase involved in cell wall biosynthesis
MIRVGFIINLSDASWTGGANYFTNLLHAIAESERIEPVILMGSSTSPGILPEFPDIEKIDTDVGNPARKWLVRRAAEKLYGRHFITEQFLRSHNIAVLSHSGHLGRRSRFPTIGWIPDFQHVRLPEFFSEQERQNRDRWFTQLADFCFRVIVSSEDARNDLEKFRPSTIRKARTLRFVSGLRNVPAVLEPRESLFRRHGIDAPYFHLPNQFWIHKNHAVVLDALKHARTMGHPMRVIATGNTQDARRPGHFEEFMRRVTELGCAEEFKVLGLVSYADLIGLMRYSTALINPSLFEGWSTTVEEAKSLGKTIILSDIPVHREQAPEKGRFFDPGSPTQLAHRMIDVADSYSREREMAQFDRAQAELPQRIRAFAACFEQIVLDAVSGVDESEFAAQTLRSTTTSARQ